MTSVHLLGLPHTVTHPDYSVCAYTTKVRRLAPMLRGLGYSVIHYGHEASVVDCDEHVTVTTQADLDKAYPGYDYKKAVFTFNNSDHAYRTFYANSISEIHRRKQHGDFLFCMWGSGVKAVADAHPDMLAVEPGIGYAGGHFAKYKVFESYSLLNAYLGMHAVGEAGRCENYSVVIPNYFDLADFTFDEGHDGYYLYLGRITTAKGLHIAIQACEAVGARLIVAGQGKLEDVGYGGPGQPPVPPMVDFVGHADVEQRRRLLSRAKATFVLSQYSEPFGGVAVESMLSGTPVITSDFGAFPETVLQGIAGYRTRTFGEILWAMGNVHRIDPAGCRAWAVNNYSTEQIAPLYGAFLRSITAIHDGHNGWYWTEPPGGNLDRYGPVLGKKGSNISC